MKKTALLLLLFFVIGSRCIEGERENDTAVGKKAYSLTSEIIKMGPRPPGSKGIESVRTWLKKEVATLGFSIQTDTFEAETPIGKIEMKNLSYLIPGLIPGKGGKEVVLVAHYDSKRFVGIHFVGANDAASSVALLLALTPEIVAKKFPFDVRILFVDGEEALVSWSEKDSLYGSRRFVRRAKPSEIKLAVVVDMIGDKDLKFIDNMESTESSRNLLKEVLKASGNENLIETTPTQVQDDHYPFLEGGIPVLHLMDFTYPPWHTEKDTLENISSKSLSISGEVILQILQRTH